MNKAKPLYIKVATNFSRNFKQKKEELFAFLQTNDNQVLTINMALVLQKLIETSEQRVSVTIEEATGLSSDEVREAVNQLMALGVIETYEVSV